MNHLAHFKVSHPDADLIVGGFLGDFVKGRLKGEFPADVERGIRLHRAVDAFADRHPIVHRSISRFEPRFRRFGPIMVDVIYDHCLACKWHAFHHEDIECFCDNVFAALDGRAHVLPENARGVASRIIDSRSMTAYDDEAFVARSFASLSRRLTRANPLDDAFGEFEANREALSADFELFFPKLLAFCERWRSEDRLYYRRSDP